MIGRIFILAFACLLLSGCGYHHPAADLPGWSPSAIYAGPWENRSNELSLESLLLQKTADWLQQSPLIRLEGDPELADYLLTGTIEAVNFPASAFSSTDRATTINAWVKVSYRLTSRPDKRLLWEIRDVVRERNFRAGTDALRQRGGKEAALAVIADELAEQIYLKVLDTLTAPPEPVEN